MIDYKQLYIGDVPNENEKNANHGIIFKFRQWVKNPACKPDCFDENYKGFVLKEDTL